MNQSEHRLYALATLCATVVLLGIVLAAVRCNAANNDGYRLWQQGRLYQIEAEKQK